MVLCGLKGDGDYGALHNVRTWDVVCSAVAKASYISRGSWFGEEFLHMR